jgi:septum formation protein
VEAAQQPARRRGRLPVVLASASPRRRQLLAAAGVGFELAPVEVDEELSGFVDPAQAALELACRKALAAAAEHVRRDAQARSLVLGADTVVAVERGGRWVLLGKPADEQEAAEMLAALGGTRHQVLTGVCCVRCPDGARAMGVERTWVTMRPLGPEEVAAYVTSGEWRDKAGGYAIQETADRFVTALEEGGFDNVVGLPVALTLGLLDRAEEAPAVPRT